METDDKLICNILLPICFIVMKRTFYLLPICPYVTAVLIFSYSITVILEDGR
jgi:hypothetical protein